MTPGGRRGRGLGAAHPFQLDDVSLLELWVSSHTVPELRALARGMGWALSGLRREDVVDQLLEHYGSAESAEVAIDALAQGERRLLGLVAWAGDGDTYRLARRVTALAALLPAGWLAELERSTRNTEAMVEAISALCHRGYLISDAPGYAARDVFVPDAFAARLWPLPELTPPPPDPAALRPVPAPDPIRALAAVTRVLTQRAPLVRRPPFGPHVATGPDGLPHPGAPRPEFGAPLDLSITVPPSGPLLAPPDEAAAAQALAPSPGLDGGDAVAFWTAVMDRSAALRASGARLGPPAHLPAEAGVIGLGVVGGISQLLEAWFGLRYGQWDELSWLQHQGVDWLVKRPWSRWGTAPPGFDRLLTDMRLTAFEMLSRWPPDADGPGGGWVELDRFCAALHAARPAFCSAAKDVWFLADAGSGKPLGLGDGDWQRGPGQVLRYMVRGPLHWLGMTDLALDECGNVVAARLSALARALLFGEPLVVTPPQRARWLDDTSVLVTVSLGHAPLVAALETCADCPGFVDEHLHFRLGPASAGRAFERDMPPDVILANLTRAGAHPPPGLRDALAGWWAGWGRLRHYDRVAVLELADELLAHELLAGTDLGARLAYRCGPATFVVAADDVEAVLATLRAAGHTPRVLTGGGGS